MSLDYIRLGKYVNMTITKTIDVSVKGVEKYVLSQEGDHSQAPKERFFAIRLMHRNTTLIKSVSSYDRFQSMCMRSVWSFV